MSQTVQSSQAGSPHQTYRVEIHDVEDLEAAEAYIQNNPGKRLILDYRRPVISRGWGESSETEDTEVHVRSLGGATTYEDSNSMGILQSGGCFEDFQEWIANEVSDVVEANTYVDGKDIFADYGRGRSDPKIVGFGARMDYQESPNLYGASWREEAMTPETVQLIEEDHTATLPEQVAQQKYNIKEESGVSLERRLAPEAETIQAPELLEPHKERELPENRTTRRPASCAVFWSPEEDYSFNRSKLDTAVLPWDIS